MLPACCCTAAFYSAAVLLVLPLMAALSVAFLRDPYGALGLWGTQKSAVCILFHAEKVFLILETVFACTTTYITGICTYSRYVRTTYVVRFIMPDLRIIYC
jgi:hypothetical protein